VRSWQAFSWFVVALAALATAVGVLAEDGQQESTIRPVGGLTFVDEFELTIANRRIFTMRGTVAGVSPADRAWTVRERFAELVDWVRTAAAGFIFTTALPPAVAAASRAALQVMQDESWRRQRVLGHVARFRREAAGLGLRLPDSCTPIQPVILGSEAAAVAASEALLAHGLWIPAIRPPTVPTGSSRLRITFSAAHEPADVDRLLDALASLARPSSADDAP